MTIIRTARAGTYGPPITLSGDQGRAARDLYRRTHPQVVKLWKTGERFLDVLFVGNYEPWPECPAVEAHNHRLFFRPSGLWLDFTTLRRTVENRIDIYHTIDQWLRKQNAEITKEKTWAELRTQLANVKAASDLDTTYKKTLHNYGVTEEMLKDWIESLPAKQSTWHHQVRDGWRKTYGARLVENLIQFLARMVISERMVAISRLGLKVPLTVHDDVFILVPDDRTDLWDQAVKIMEAPLSWLPECPIACEAKLLDALDE